MATVAKPGAVREVLRKVRGMPTSDGAGVRMTRVIGSRRSIRSIRSCCSTSFAPTTRTTTSAGFPDHPHRGFETVTYMLAGRMRHGDNQGNTGLLGPGSVQWMTAGKRHRAFRISGAGRRPDVGLPALGEFAGEGQAHEAALPRHPRRRRSPRSCSGRARERACSSGSVDGVEGTGDRGRDRAAVLRSASRRGRVATRPTLPGRAQRVRVRVSGRRASRRGRDRRSRAASSRCSRSGASLPVTAGAEGARVIVVAGRPLNEPVARYGPFVMNTTEEIHQAFADYRAGKL